MYAKVGSTQDKKGVKETVLPLICERAVKPFKYFNDFSLVDFLHRLKCSLQNVIHAAFLFKCTPVLTSTREP